MATCLSPSANTTNKASSAPCSLSITLFWVPSNIIQFTNQEEHQINQETRKSHTSLFFSLLLYGSFIPTVHDQLLRISMEDDGLERLSTCDGIYEEHIYRRRRRHHHLLLASANKSRVTKVHELLQCPICTNSMYPPINQCLNGHTLCSICKLKVNNCCPTCGEELGDIRCLALEKVAESLLLPCKYGSLGCMEIFPYYRKAKHEAKCNFRPYNCPYPGSECSVVGDIAFLVHHLRDDHKVDMHNECSFDHLYVKSNPRKMENAAKMLMVFNCYSQYFCLHFEAFKLGIAPVYIAFLRFMGDVVEAQTFSYRLEVGAHGRKLIWEGTPRSIRDSHHKVRDSHDGLIIQRNMALFFSSGQRKELKLRVTGRIWKAKST